MMSTSEYPRALVTELVLDTAKPMMPGRRQPIGAAGHGQQVAIVWMLRHRVRRVQHLQ